MYTYVGIRDDKGSAYTYVRSRITRVRRWSVPDKMADNDYRGDSTSSIHVRRLLDYIRTWCHARDAIGRSMFMPEITFPRAFTEIELADGA